MALTPSSTASFLVVALLALGFAGCVESEPGLLIGTPSIGSRASYIGSDGSHLEVEVLRSDVKKDAFRQERDVLILGFTLRPSKNTDIEIRFEEAVDFVTGTHIRQDLFCHFTADLPTSQDTACVPDFVRVFMGAHGLPGALGMGPLWGKRIPKSGDLPVREVHPLMDGFELDYAASPTGSCAQLARVGGKPHEYGVPWLPGTVLDGPFAICDGDVFPSGFVSQMKMPQGFSDEEYPAFSKVGEQHPEVAMQVPRNGVALRDQWVETSPPSRTSLLSSTSPVTFPSLEAHEQALGLDAEYREFFKAHEDSAVVHADWGRGSLTLGAQTIREEYEQWFLVLRDGQGEGVETRIRKVTQTILGGNGTTRYELAESGAPEWEGGRPQGLGSTSFIDPGRAYGISQAVVSAEAPTVYAHSFLAMDGGIYALPKVLRDDRFTVGIYYRPPDAPNQYLYKPWIVNVDSITGAIVHVQLSPELHERV